MSAAGQNEIVNYALPDRAGVFDAAATSYDVEFSHSNIGRILRQIVRKKLDVFLQPAVRAILEINCGTGEDAIYMAGKGHKVTATDGSAEMIKQADRKQTPGANALCFEQLDFNKLGERFSPNTFDIVFSNFGGLNCAAPGQLKSILTDIGAILRPGGRFIGVIMGTNCMWEKIYYSLKGDSATAKRRKEKSGADTIIGDNKFKTYYYSPADVEALLPETITISKKYPVGLLIPPTYVEGYFSKHRTQLNILYGMEQLVGEIGSLANMADHFMIVTEKQRL